MENLEGIKREPFPLLLTEDELNWIKSVLTGHSETGRLTEDELNWLKQISDEYGFNYEALIQLPPHYVRFKKTSYERNKNKENVRKELDALRKKMTQFTPNELLELRNKRKREWCGFENFAGIYIIHNRENSMYYIGKAERLFDRAYKHFLDDKTGNPEIYRDYRSGDEFSISFIPLDSTFFSDLNELEDNAIRAYDSFQHGYNRMGGNYMDQLYLTNDGHQKVAEFLLYKLKGTELHISLSNTRKRYKFIFHLCAELGLLLDGRLARNFDKLMKLHKKKKIDEVPLELLFLLSKGIPLGI
ncbi:GIY-YIG nuclease family protein [Neobacillus cucumis]|uniref:GIY-YIG nuclease family protein n=1 Tax=Neobacillus cucumis TaxID=1740721 RepID=UPI0020420924|nr:GIY-YIG nuclease family protein [Neobacillus cucumis]MCM3725093.1 GIY-YIG nuclease family protein [Neobacillus cucumis]